MTHVHSNWNNTYTNGITSTDCYAGCTAITHIDNENIVTYEGKEGLDEIPVTWGGYDFTKDVTTVMVVEIPSDNYRLSIYGYNINMDTQTSITSWGDKSSDTLTYHTYEKAGTYVVKTKYNRVDTNNENATLRNCITKVLQTRTTDLMHCFRYCTKLTYVNIDDCTINFGNFLHQCGADAKPVIVSSKNLVVAKGNPWIGCSFIVTQEDVDTWDISNRTSLTNLFEGFKGTAMDVSKWDFSKITNVSYMFQNSNVKVIDTSKWNDTSKITAFSNFCNGATCEYITLTFSGSMWAIMHSCKYVKHVTWKDCTVTIENYSFPCFANEKVAEWQITFDNAIISAENGNTGGLQNFNHLNVESLMSIINALVDRTGMDSDTLTLGSAHLAKLTPEQIKIATDKNWTVV
jgi:hypothetical protein